LEGFGGKQIEGQRLFPVTSQEEHVPPPMPAPLQLPSHSSSMTSQSKKDKHTKKEYLKQMSELDNIVQHQHLENKKLEKLFSDAKKILLQLSLALIQKQESTPADPWGKNVASEVTGFLLCCCQ
jgi:hypothetical protein